MIIMKFGGTSVGTADRILTACQLVKDQIEKKPVVVVSAHNSEKYRMTNTLIKAANRALEGSPDSGEIIELQRGICNDLGVSCGIIDHLLEEIDTILQGISMIGEISGRTMDHLLSFGERMSSLVFTEILKTKFDLNAQCVPSYELGLRTDSNFGEANHDKNSYDDIKNNVSVLEFDVLVITGFLGMNTKGDITTIGRGGSDLTATIFGAALNAEEVQIWTDVDGVMTADPDIVPEARSVPELTFMEAAELAWYGAQVLHPISILPAIENDVPVQVLNTLNPDNPGTRICARLDDPQQLVKSIPYMTNMTLITITAAKMLGAYGFLERTFGIFGKHQMDIHMIATAEISFSLTIPGDEDKKLELAVKELEEFADVVVDKNMAVICVVGEKMYGEIGIAGRVFKTIGDAGIKIRMISMEAHEYNISLLVDEKDVKTAVRALHHEFFEK